MKEQPNTGLRMVLDQIKDLAGDRLVGSIAVKVGELLVEGKRVHEPTLNMVLREINLPTLAFDPKEATVDQDGWVVPTPTMMERMKAEKATRSANPFYTAARHFRVEDMRGRGYWVVGVEKVDLTGLIAFKAEDDEGEDALIIRKDEAVARFPSFLAAFATALIAARGTPGE